jgi:hypothetical protein
MTALWLALVAPYARAQSVPTNAEAPDILQETREGTSLTSIGSAPFHLIAKVHFEVGAKAFDGTYELLWARPDRYREEFRLGAIGETDVAADDRIYVLRTTPTLSYPLWRIRSSLAFSTGSPLSSSKMKVTVVPSSPSSADQFCIDTEHDERIEEKFCYDTMTREVLSMNIVINDPTPAPTYGFELTKAPIRRWELTEFVKLGSKRCPRHVSFRGTGEHLEIRIENLEEVKAFAESVFAPPTQAVARDWCPSPVQAEKDTDPAPPIFHMFNLDVLPAFYVLIGRDGRAEKFAPLISANEPGDTVIGQWVHTAHFPVRTCGEKPIEYEFVVAPGAFASYGVRQ